MTPWQVRRHLRLTAFPSETSPVYLTLFSKDVHLSAPQGQPPCIWADWRLYLLTSRSWGLGSGQSEEQRRRLEGQLGVLAKSLTEHGGPYLLGPSITLVRGYCDMAGVPLAASAYPPLKGHLVSG